MKLGESGKHLAREILKNNFFRSTTLIGRRTVDDEIYKNGNQVIVDFENLDANADAFKQDIIFCCLGTTRQQSDKAGFRKIDYDYVVNSARVAKANGCKQFHLITSAGTDKNSLLWQLRIKGESEEAISQMDFEKVFFYRPRFLESENGRSQHRSGEKLFLTLVKPLKCIAPKLLHTPMDKQAKAMIRNAIIHNSEPKVEIIQNTNMYELAAEYDREFNNSAD